MKKQQRNRFGGALLYVLLKSERMEGEKPLAGGGLQSVSRKVCWLALNPIS